MGKIVAIDLFSGAGGTTSGLKKSGINVQVAIEIDPVAVKTYKLNNPEVYVIDRDIKLVSGDEIKQHLKIGSDDKVMLVACPPCQGFSTIGTNNENDERNQLVFQFLRLINELNPDFLLMENVVGMIRAKNKNIFKSFLTSINNAYSVNYDIVNTADYGVPQLRKRLVLHGIKKELLDQTTLTLNLPPKTHSNIPELNLLPWVNADVIMDLPPINGGEEFIGEGIYNHVANKLSDLNIERIIHIRNNGGNRSSLPESLVLNCHKNISGHKDVYGILDITKPSITITGGCMTYSKGRFGHPTQNRALSAREAARLQSFDDDYIFVGNRGQLAKQIGNAVPVKLAQASGSYFMSVFRELNE
ncbi:DNA cytosine methyltransferase [Streptococcus sanguinis]|jgi:DNA (cytosine-5-)-methyltransferase|uniref:DNA (cytosine-5-)-methyltransferase n=1 Tax=Streptococcus sanguinis SK160 TaxID=888812 RepID=F0IWQ6_STRSA|nr:DNA cytosine methyltransferase [Streptococcus sanguinis]RKW04124.1 MAG: DNA cytosine methyltransferase [Streptococcus sp.]EGD38271.1 modification methylase HgiDII [Streptococcus sanguinis SK160]MCY7023949.1 DNA cytosine methyltransferase [Streptococcus sanguinis]RSI00172.1 Modification methylase HaeIII [Streptococcus sanguinis]RSI02427.1 Modification methylase HaeIII [Streptococcus sanguinis]